MDFWFEFLDIHMNEKTTYHDCHGFKWQNINIYPILIVFLCNPTPFLTCWIEIAPTMGNERFYQTKKSWNMHPRFYPKAIIKLH